MDIFDNELVRRYFGFQQGEIIPVDYIQQDVVPKYWTAYKIQKSMQDPIKKGELYLRLPDGLVVECLDPTPADLYHPFMLRLPGRFQIRNWIEERIQETATLLSGPFSNRDAIVIYLRELVEKAKEQHGPHLR